jgi:hypothetical protein
MNGANTLSIPTTWDPTWFRHFIHNMLKGADVRNASGINGVTVTGNISSPYATISGNGGPSSVVGTTNQITVTTVAGVATVSLAPNIVIPAPASGSTLQVNGVASSTSFPVLILGSSTSGQSNGLLIEAGTTSADRAIVVTNKAVTINLFQLFGDNSGTLGAGISWSAPGQVTIGASSLIVSGAQGIINSGFTHVEINGSSGGVAGISYVIATGGTDSKIWDSTILSATQFAFRTVNDADNSAVNWLRVTRSGITPTAIDFIATAMTTSGTSQATGLIATAAAPTVAAGQVGYGGTTSTTASTTAGGITLPVLAAGFIVVNIAGTQRKIPLYAN